MYLIKKVNQMIEAFTGNPGAGKTYNMVRRAYKQHKKGRQVYANFHCTFATYFKELDDIMHVRDALILIDEASIYLPAQTWNKLPKDFFMLIRQHRHSGLDLWYTAQDMADVIKALRVVTQFENTFEKMLRFCTCQSYSLRAGKRKRKSDCTSYHWLNKKVFNLYDTN